MNGADLVIATLKKLNVDTIFGYPGGAILPIYDALFRDGSIKHVLVRHEQAAVHAAEAYAKVSGKVGVVMVTSGPGITNCVTGLMDALSDSIPIVVISGQVFSTVLGTDAFQECDAIGITRHCTKYNILVEDKEKIGAALLRAFTVASSGRPGPVHVDIPKDFQSQEVSSAAFSSLVFPVESDKQTEHRTGTVITEELQSFFQLLKAAKKPLLYIGGGLARGGNEARDLLARFIEMTKIPCTSTLMGLGSVQGDSNCFLGMLGMHGTYEANLATHHCDLLINIGARFDDRVTGRLDSFSPGSKKVHVDIDESNINKVVDVDLKIISDGTEFLRQLVRFVDDQPSLTMESTGWKDWWNQIAQWREVNSLRYKQGEERIKPQEVIRRVSSRLQTPKASYITTDVGQHQMWVAQHFCFQHPRQLLTSGGLGTMGFGFPAAIGCQVFDPEAKVVAFTGDASILMNIQELSTAVQYRLPVKIIILNNGCMGMVHQWQTLFYDSRYSQSYMETLPDFVALARSFGADGYRVERLQDLDEAISKMFDSPKPFILDVVIESEEEVLPMIQPGAGHQEMLLPKA